jgi:hypothetical protein
MSTGNSLKNNIINSNIVLTKLHQGSKTYALEQELIKRTRNSLLKLI